METKEILNKYVKSFRVECYIVVTGAPADGSMPINAYNIAYNNARKELIEELSLADEHLNKIDAIHRTFISKVNELQNYGAAEEYILNVIEKL